MNYEASPKFRRRLVKVYNRVDSIAGDYRRQKTPTVVAVAAVLTKHRLKFAPGHGVHEAVEWLKKAGFATVWTWPLDDDTPQTSQPKEVYRDGWDGPLKLRDIPPEGLRMIRLARIKGKMTDLNKKKTDRARWKKQMEP